MRQNSRSETPSHTHSTSHYTLYIRKRRAEVAMYSGQCPVFGKKWHKKYWPSPVCAWRHTYWPEAGERIMSLFENYTSQSMKIRIKDCFFRPSRDFWSGISKKVWRKSIGHRLKIAWRHKYWPGPIWVVSETHNWTVNWPLMHVTYEVISSKFRTTVFSLCVVF